MSRPVKAILPTRGQRSTEDRLLRLTDRTGEVVEVWSPPGRAQYVLTRYSREAYDARRAHVFAEDVTDGPGGS
jgi:hypothetical protein